MRSGNRARRCEADISDESLIIPAGVGSSRGRLAVVAKLFLEHFSPFLGVDG